MQYRRSKAQGATFFFTLVTFQRNKILCYEENVALIKESFQYIIRQHPFRIRAFILLPEHIHCIWTLPENDNNYSVRWSLIKGYFSRHCNGKYKGVQTASMFSKSEQAVWQRRFWEHQIRNADDFIKHVEYIHYNPVKHKLVNSPRDWPYSSFHRYVKQGIYDGDWGEGREIDFDSNIGHE
ncbi:MAG: transposase [Candidatus Brocadiaceae bacterium]